MKKKLIVTSLVILFAFFGSAYSLLLTTPGIEVSCPDQSIIGVRNLPPPLLQGIQEEICRANVSVTVEDDVICIGELKVSTFESGVFPCEELKDLENTNISVQVVFVDKNGDELNRDSKELFIK